MSNKSYCRDKSAQKSISQQYFKDNVPILSVVKMRLEYNKNVRYCRIKILFAKHLSAINKKEIAGASTAFMKRLRKWPVKMWKLCLLRELLITTIRLRLSVRGCRHVIKVKNFELYIHTLATRLCVTSFKIAFVVYQFIEVILNT